MNNSHHYRIIFLLSEGTNLFDFSGIAQVFYEAIAHGLDAGMVYCAHTQQLESAPGLSIGKLTDFRKLVPGKNDILFIMSADPKFMLAKNFNPPADLLNWIATAHSNGARVSAICNGAFLLARTGLLNGVKCTTHWKRTKELKEKYPYADVQENILFVEDKGLITSAGATSGVDVALHILSELKDDYFTYKISRELVVYTRRSGNHAQNSVYLSYRNHMHSAIHKVQDWLHVNLQKHSSLYELARMANMSERNFTRVFKRETGVTVNDYITRLRLEKIKQMQKHPNYSRKEMAKACGLQSERHLARLLRLN